jgi:hypothetical protein
VLFSSPRYLTQNDNIVNYRKHQILKGAFWGKKDIGRGQCPEIGKFRTLDETNVLNLLITDIGYDQCLDSPKFQTLNAANVSLFAFWRHWPRPMSENAPKKDIGRNQCPEITEIVLELRKSRH